MNARDLSFKLTKQWQKWPDAEVYLWTDDGLVSVADIEYNEDDNRFVVIPEGTKLNPDKTINWSEDDAKRVAGNMTTNTKEATEDNVIHCHNCGHPVDYIGQHWKCVPLVQIRGNQQC